MNKKGFSLHSLVPILMKPVYLSHVNDAHVLCIFKHVVKFV